jgi:hypothetical protein
MTPTAPGSPAPFSSVTAAKTTPAVNAAIGAARDLPDLVNRLQVVDPGLATQLEGHALIYSKTMYGQILAPIITLVVTKFGLGWDANTCELATGIVIMIGGVAFRWFTTSPISGWFSKGATPAQQIGVPTVPPPAPAAAPERTGAVTPRAAG